LFAIYPIHQLNTKKLNLSVVSEFSVDKPRHRISTNRKRRIL